MCTSSLLFHNHHPPLLPLHGASPFKLDPFILRSPRLSNLKPESEIMRFTLITSHHAQLLPLKHVYGLIVRPNQHICRPKPALNPSAGSAHPSAGCGPQTLRGCSPLAVTPLHMEQLAELQFLRMKGNQRVQPDPTRVCLSAIVGIFIWPCLRHRHSGNTNQPSQAGSQESDCQEFCSHCRQHPNGLSDQI